MANHVGRKPKKRKKLHPAEQLLKDLSSAVEKSAYQKAELRKRHWRCRS
jgi:hypothetical protein